MSGTGEPRHVVVTPCRDGISMIRKSIQSMSRQTIRPDLWVILAHNYPLSDLNILEQETTGMEWVLIVPVSDNSSRKRGGQIARLVNTGIEKISVEWDFLSKIDSDIELPPEYFSRIFDKFTDFPRLGIASGTCIVMKNNTVVIEKVSKDHTRGAIKTYRKQCFEEIGGIREVDGWDGVDNLVAQMNGWQTRNFQDIEVLHYRMTGSSSGMVRGCFEAGKFSFSLRYHPLFIVARSIHRMPRTPFIIGGLSMLAGYIKSRASGHPPSLSTEEIYFLRQKQKKRLRFWWR